MLRLLKYEMRKTLASKLILLGVTVIAQAVFLAGLWGNRENTLAVGTVLLFFIAITGIALMGILSYATEDKLLLLSSHLVEEMEAIADRAVFISEGRLVECVDLEDMRTQQGVSMADRYRQIYGHTEG